MEVLFPELQESEDERIRKELVAFLEELSKLGKDTNFDRWKTSDCANWIAWLEKQVSPQMVADAYLRGCDDTEKKWLKKQSEQKAFDYENVNIQQKDFAPVEPKFKVGDWILYSGDHYEGVRHITKINENGYYIERNGLPHGIIPFNHEICMRLWTIQDAKAGDVLSDGTTIFIFKDLLSDGSVMSYCDYDTDSDESDAFCPLSMNLICSKITPATKEQREQLEKAMADAGYEWDAEKKELKHDENE